MEETRESEPDQKRVSPIPVQREGRLRKVQRRQFPTRPVRVQDPAGGVAVNENSPPGS